MAEKAVTRNALRVTGVVLAAGAGKRMGKHKLLIPFRGKPLLEWTLELVERLSLDCRLIVLGAQAEEILQTLFPCPDTGRPSPIPREASRLTRHGNVWQVLYNPDWQQGMGTSLRRAAEVVTGGMLVFLGDMPWVPEKAARAVLSRAGDHPVAPGFRGQRGFPVYLPPHLGPELLALSKDYGARHLIPDCELIPCDDPGVVRDVDFEEDLEGAPTAKAPKMW